MNRFLLSLSCLLILTSATFKGPAGIEVYTGVWTNEKADISKLEISTKGDEVMIQVWEKQTENLKSWGWVSAERYDRVSQAHPFPTLTATYELENRQVLIVLSSNGENIEAKLVSFSHNNLETRHAIFQYEKLLPVVPVETDENIPLPIPSGRINGRAMGMARSTASVFHLSLYGPDNPNQVQGTQTFSSEDKSYEFAALEDGRYWLIVDSKAMTGIEAYPTFQEIEIRNGKTFEQNVELK